MFPLTTPRETAGPADARIPSAANRLGSARSDEFSFGVVILVQGNRGDQLTRAVDSVFAQRGVELDVVCVGNGCRPAGLPEQVRTVVLPRDIGVAAGRDAGAPHVTGEFLFFLDEDAWLPDDTALLRIAQLMRSRPRLGLLQPRIEDPDGGAAPRRWIPRFYKRSAAHSSHVFSVWEGAVCARRSAYDSVGGWPAPYWYMHEGIELAWRMWDAGHRVWYMGDVVVAHPSTDLNRDAEQLYLNARNRVWLARRNLPWPLGWMYVGSWTLMHSVAWSTTPRQLMPWFAGWTDGWRSDPWGDGESRRKLSAAGVLRMVLHGRVPVV